MREELLSKAGILRHSGRVSLYNGRAIEGRLTS